MSILERPLTYADLQEMQVVDRNRYELIGGELIVCPSPAPKHQKAATNLTRHLGNHVADHDLGEVYAAPTDVRLSPFDTVVPDVFFVAKARLGIVNSDVAVEGAPDLVAEVLSPSTKRYDQTRKAALYATFGVHEYWLVDIDKRTVLVLALRNGEWEPVEQPAGRVRSLVLPELDLTLDAVFAGIA